MQLAAAIDTFDTFWFVWASTQTTRSIALGDERLGAAFRTVRDFDCFVAAFALPNEPKGTLKFWQVESTVGTAIDVLRLVRRIPCHV